MIRHNDWSTLRVPELGQWRPSHRVSVVVPAHECQPALDLMLASLARQTYPAELMEVVVVDDGSQPRLRLPSIRPDRTRLVWAPDHTSEPGIAAACAVGVAASDGDIVLRLDADMVVYPEHVEAHARWHHEIPYAVTLGSKQFVDVRPGGPGGPDPQDVADKGAERLFDPASGEPHSYVERLLRRTDRLRSADHLVFLAHVGATVGMRREMYEAAGGFDPALRRGSDTELGYRLAQAGALFVPEEAARSWHLGPSTMMRDRLRVQRYSRPFLADRMPHPRWLRGAGGSVWSVPLVTAVVEVGEQPLEVVRAAVDALLRGDEKDLHVYLVGAWNRPDGSPRSVLDDPALELRLIAETYRSEPRVRLVEQVPDSVFPSPYLLRLPAGPPLPGGAVRRLVVEADRYQAGLVRAEGGVELWRTAALGRARWVRRDGDAMGDIVARTHGVRAADLGRASGMPATIEVGGLRSWARATALVAALAARRLAGLVRPRRSRRRWSWPARRR